MEENWFSGLNSLRKAIKAGEITDSTRAEIMTHPDMVDGVPSDSLHNKHIPMEELAAAVAENGVLCSSGYTVE